MDGSSRERRPTSWTARILAPVLLVVVIAAIVLVVSGSLSSDNDDSSKPDHKSVATNPSCTPSDAQAVKNGYYVVQVGDTAGLSGIAVKTCLSVDRLISLNPNLDPQTLQVDNCIDLIPDGCKKLAGG
jgi:LysM repeat protein